AENFAAIDVEIKTVQDEAAAKGDAHAAGRDDDFAFAGGGKGHDQNRIAAKNMAKRPSTTMTEKIDFTTELVVCLPSDSAEPCTFMPSIQAVVPIIRAIAGALMMPTRKVEIQMASRSLSRMVTGVMPP